MGLPGSGKTTLAKALKQKLDYCYHLNADEVRKKYDDWDFSEDGRIRQSERMSNLADSYLKSYKYCVSPEGNGIDCYRTWEALYMKTIPICKRSILVEEFAKTFPIYIVDDWKDLDVKDLEKQLEKALDDIEELKDSNREMKYTNGTH